MAESLKSVPLIFVVGPTATGKTEKAIQWAGQVSAGILNCDSIQGYKDLNIGSAKPDFKKYPSTSFYLFDEIKAPQVWTAGEFRRKALELLKQKVGQKKVFIVGGSGFYIQALEKGMYPLRPVPKTVTQKLKKIQSQKGYAYLYQKLTKKDPESAKKISPKDKYRIFRALSLIESEGKALSQIKKEFQGQKLDWPYCKVAFRNTKEQVLQRVEKRAKTMLKKGLIEEIEFLRDKGFQNWPPLHSVGYKEGLLYLEGKIKKEDLLKEIVFSVMVLFKKQETWFKRDKSILWLNGDQPALELYKKFFK